MLDWIQFVRERLGPLGLMPSREAEIHAELADHLEDCWQRSPTPSERDGLLRREVPDWSELTQEIRRAEEVSVTQRTRVFWLPSLAAMFFAMAALRLLFRLGLHPEPYWITKGGVIQVYPVWSLILAMVGLLVGWWVRRSGGTVSDRLLAALFPAWGLFLFLSAVFPVAFFIDRQVQMDVKLASYGVALTTFVLFPALALLAGALPFLRGRAPA